jgi:hypothetical protein
MAKTDKKTGLASRMENFYFEIESPDGKKQTISDAEQTEEKTTQKAQNRVK